MNIDFEIRADVYALSETEAIKRLEDAFMMSIIIGDAIVECHREHVSSTSEWMHLSQTDSVVLLNGGSGAGADAELSEWGPAVGKFVIERNAASISTAVFLRVVSSHADAIMAVLFTE